MANKSQVTVDLKINANAQIKNAEQLRKSIEKVMSDFSFGKAIDKQFLTSIEQLDKAIKQLKKGTSEGSFISNKELEQIMQAGDKVSSIAKSITDIFNRSGDVKNYTNEVVKISNELDKLQKRYKEITKVEYQSSEQAEKKIQELKQTYIQQEKNKQQAKEILDNEKLLTEELQKQVKKYSQAKERIAKYNAALIEASAGATPEQRNEILQSKLRLRGGATEEIVQSRIASEQSYITKKEVEYRERLQNIIKGKEGDLTADDLSEISQVYKDIGENIEKLKTEKGLEIVKDKEKETEGIKTLNMEVEKTALNLNNAGQQSLFLGDAFQKIKNAAGYLISANIIIDQIVQKTRQAVDFTKEVDKDMTQIGLVLGQTSGRVWKNFETYSSMAERLNTTTSAVTGAMKLFYQQGLNTAQVNKMVEASAIAAALGETSLAEASETLTSVINSYSLSARDAMMVTDKISQVAISSASDFNEISTAIEKVASSAANAGLDLDHLMGYLGKMIETTR